jgi:hypothetical protein
MRFYYSILFVILTFSKKQIVNTKLSMAVLLLFIGVSSAFAAAPGPVTGLTCTVLSNTSISASWTAGTGSTSYYYVRIDRLCLYTGDYLSGDSHSVTAPTTTYTWTGLSAGTTYYVHVASVSGSWQWTGCVNSSSYTTTGSQASATWTGGTSTNWATGSNWSTGVAPDEFTNVTIASGTTFAPTISSSTTAYVNNLTINSSVTLGVQCTSGGLLIYGNLTNNGSINHTGTIYIYFLGCSKTISGTGNFYAGTICPFSFEDGSDYTIGTVASNTLQATHVYIRSTATAGNLSIGSNTLVTQYFIQVGVFNQNTGTLEICGPSTYTMSYGAYSGGTWANPGGGSTNPHITDANFNEGTGTTFYNAGAYTTTDIFRANDQTIKDATYYNLKIRTNNGYVATVGSSALVTVSNDLTVLNPSTAGGVATTAYAVTIGNNLNIGATGTALTLNLADRFYRASGNGTLTMGNVAAHAINITYTHASNLCITGFGTPTFYGTVTYNSASPQMVTAASYNNLTISSAGTRTLAGIIDVNAILTLNAGTLDVGSGLNYAITLAGDLVRATAATYTARSGTITFDGAATQRINVTSAAGTTPTNSDITFYNVIIDGTDVKLYYDKTNDRYINVTDFTINTSKNAYLIGN